MTAFTARARASWTVLLGTLASKTGAALGVLGRSGPGIAGPVLCAYGVWEIYQPAGWITAGGILWLYDLHSGRGRQR